MSSKSFFILGTIPNLAIAELESLLTPEHIEVFSDELVIADNVTDDSFFDRLGGSQKTGQILAETNLMGWSQIENYIRNELAEVIMQSVEGKINIGISCYGIKIDPKRLNASNLALKKQLKSAGRSVRIVPNQAPALSSAQVEHNNLARSGFELIVAANNNKIVFARTTKIQDIYAYGARDQARPKRDAKIGMLPPKLAQIMINLANPTPGSRVLDPFCGSGVILQESLLMGFQALGSDLNPRMVDYAQTNLRWLEENFGSLPEWQVVEGDATKYKWEGPFDAVASETYLGKPLFKLPPPVELDHQAKEVSRLIKDFLTNLSDQIKSGTTVCLAIPAWVAPKELIRLTSLDHLENIGYNRMSFRHVDTNELIYQRSNQLVARQLLVLNRM